MTSMTAAEIAQALGGATRNGPGWSAGCPCHQDKTPSLSLRDGDSQLLVHCFAGCNSSDILTEFRQRGWLDDDRKRDFRPPRKVPPLLRVITNSAPVNSSDFAHRIWHESVDPRGTLGEKYLNGRGLALGDDLAGRVLRFHSRCPFGKGADGRTIHVPALIAAFRPIRADDESKPPVAIHRIGLGQDGRKLGKMMLGPVGGCAIKLDADENGSHGLGIAEGLETALAVRATGRRPIWALGSAGAIANFAPTPGIRALTIFADHDSAGLTAAQVCAERWQAAFVEVFIRWPNRLGRDYAEGRP